MLQYSEQDLKNALADIRENGTKIREASRKFLVPKTTLIDRLSGRKPDKVKNLDLLQSSPKKEKSELRNGL
ncbi:hypothetical protein NQ314_003484 [Rhamnusium bicolor]|uniref:HTH psq-type domain-containing protein n=1 Tax=Rhamnusium bicolor TaxID=1586634 RepID=A0AAV8ZQB1_9CUCU|nr:hypothetical protein NQ314_003484 [Rhamnusium bicolor]